ncbi:hypothetical protein CLU79DRAFT_769762 [Phycomyces nitens]|nr:hypothetical protein CLU79DRAFT_769762 [Phycomyces nitens]
MPPKRLRHEDYPSSKSISDSDSDSDSTSDNTSDSDSSQDTKRTKHTPSPLEHLPYEVLTKIFILSSNSQLPIVCRSISYMLYHCSNGIKVEWLLHRHKQSVQQALQASLNFPFVDRDLISRLDWLYQQQNSDKSVIPLTNVMIPTRFFSDAKSEEDSREFVCMLLERGASPIKPKGYPIIKSAQLGRLEMVKLLVTFGADPTVRQNMALRVCAARNNKTMVSYFLDELKVAPDSETLKACVQKGLWDMVTILMEHGAVPDMSTVNYA